MTNIDTKYEDGFKAGVKHGQEEIDRTLNSRLDDDDELRAEPETQHEFDQRYPLTLAAIYKSWELEADEYQWLQDVRFKHLVIKPEPTDPKRRTYNDGFIDGLCCILVANSDVLSGDPDVSFADAWKDPGWQEALGRAAGYPSGTEYNPHWFRLVKVS